MLRRYIVCESGNHSKWSFISVQNKKESIEMVSYRNFISWFLWTWGSENLKLFFMLHVRLWLIKSTVKHVSDCQSAQPNKLNTNQIAGFLDKAPGSKQKLQSLPEKYYDFNKWIEQNVMWQFQRIARIKMCYCNWNTNYLKKIFQDKLNIHGNYIHICMVQ